ncbi:circadian clock protein KaiA [Leptolyngbya sp. AN02str]|uniref:circadian clock protein KaiA n=1 Tax=Leptolyngbya sp. AN02str TaxID=3423363 RepID=UPI003D3203D9
MLSVCSLLTTSDLSQQMSQSLGGNDSGSQAHESYTFNQFDDQQEFLTFVQREKRQVDCLVFEESTLSLDTLEQLKRLSILLPAVLLESKDSRADTYSITDPIQSNEQVIYHNALLHAHVSDIAQLPQLVEQAIAKFLKLAPQPLHPEAEINPATVLTVHSSLMQQQKRLADKLKERLGYLGVYYKRNPAHFLRHMTQPERKEVLQRLRDEYRKIILSYFSAKSADSELLNQRIDTFANLAFFSDVPVSQVVEMHIELMDEFSKQLKLEGRNDDILQDYRLTLIDVLAHLCEMYRRSIPRES